MKRIAVISALPGEVKPLVQGFAPLPTQRKTTRLWRVDFGKTEMIVACAGMGEAAAARAFAAAESMGPLDGVVSLGWVGALRDDLKAGDVLVPNIVVDAKTGERHLLARREQNTVLVTNPSVAGEREKQRLRESYDGALVDMEAAAVVRLAEMRGIPVLCLKGVTDAAGVRLPEITPYIDGMGQLRMVPFLLHVTMRPYYFPALIKMGSAGAKCADQFAGALLNFVQSAGTDQVKDLGRPLQASDFERVNRTGRMQAE